MTNAIPYALLGFVSWIAATFGPPLIALLFWHAGVQRLGRITAYLLFLPVLLGFEWATTWLIFFAAHDDGEGPPGLGVVLIPALAALIGSIALFYLCAIWAAIDRLRTKFTG